MWKIQRVSPNLALLALMAITASPVSACPMHDHHDAAPTSLAPSKAKPVAPQAVAHPAATTIESNVVVQPVNVRLPKPTMIVEQPVTTQISPDTRRSNYSARLAHLLEQINMGAGRGWLTPQQAAELRRWQADVVKEEELLRLSGGGVVPRTNIDQLERHVNGLAYVITQQINGNPNVRIAGFRTQVF